VGAVTGVLTPEKAIPAKIFTDTILTNSPETGIIKIV
jgi:hypothetical protein